MSDPAAAPEAPLAPPHRDALLVALVLAIAFFGLVHTVPGLAIRYFPRFDNSSTGELQLWAALAYLLFPAGLLAGYGFSPRSGPRLAAALRTGSSRLAKGAGVPLLAGCLLYAIGARVVRSVALLDLPITDDEQSALHGGRLLAEGRFSGVFPEPAEDFNRLCLVERDGLTASFDHLGVKVVWALGLAGPDPDFPFMLAAALPLLFLALAARRLAGGAAAVLVLVVFLASPMATLLSPVTHAHTVSRALIAAVVWAWLEARARDRDRDYAVLGLLLGAAFVTRPAETIGLTLPLLATVLMPALAREPGGARRARCLLLAAMIPLAAYFAHNRAITGSALLHPRFAPGVFGTDYVGPATLVERLGANAGFNLFLLCIWFLGPLGLPLAWLGGQRRREARLLLAGVATLLAIGVLHSDIGIHVVGPIHYSEAVVPLALAGALGARRLLAWFRLRRLDAGVALSVLAGGLVGNLPFTVVNLLALHDSAAMRAEIYAVVDGAPVQPAVVLAPDPYLFWHPSSPVAVARFAAIGSWVHRWRIPSPDPREPVRIARISEGVVERLRRSDPGRAIYQLQVDRARGTLWLAPVVVPGP